MIAEEESREGVLRRIQARLLEYLTKQVEIVQIDVPAPIQPRNPWLDNFGYFQDDPTFEDLQQEIANYRQSHRRDIVPLLTPRSNQKHG